jgi:glycine/D-amino acid oxidase-like deaminating enzyme
MIRPDPAALAAVHARAFPAPWSRDEFAALLAQPGVLAVVEPDGFILIRVVLDEAEILTLAVRPEARRKLMVSPADETDMPPHDAQPDELDVAIAVDRMQAALDIPVHRVEHRWAGLRSFTPDRSLAIGQDAAAPGFFWFIGQGGYGIQTAPAAGRFAPRAHRAPSPSSPGAG